MTPDEQRERYMWALGLYGWIGLMGTIRLGALLERRRA